MRNSEIETLLDFGAGAYPEATVVNDGVMGGRSSGRLDRGPSGPAVFEGTLSLENRGGFASVRFPVPAAALARASSLILRVRGDGRRYEARLRPERGVGTISWTAGFDTVADRWVTVEVGIADFQPTFRGTRPRGVDPLDPADVVEVGVMLKDGQAEPFRLEIDRIGVRRGGDPAARAARPGG